MDRKGPTALVSKFYIGLLCCYCSFVHATRPLQVPSGDKHTCNGSSIEEEALVAIKSSVNSGNGPVFHGSRSWSFKDIAHSQSGDCERGRNAGLMRDQIGEHDLSPDRRRWISDVLWALMMGFLCAAGLSLISRSTSAPSGRATHLSEYPGWRCALPWADLLCAFSAKEGQSANITA